MALKRQSKVRFSKLAAEAGSVAGAVGNVTGQLVQALAQAAEQVVAEGVNVAQEAAAQQ